MNKEIKRASSKNNIIETEVAIKFIKDVFERELARNLNLTRVSAPLFVFPESGLNDNLNGVERPVAFDVLDIGKNVEVVHSLAKWKRMALAKYGFAEGEGLYTDMNAIRRDEALDALHSVYVDQWDWEKIINPNERNFDTLKTAVESIYSALLRTEKALCENFGTQPVLPEKIEFMTTSELEEEFPNLSAKERENAVTKRLGAVFLMQIGAPLANGKPHDGRAPDYDDWELNGDILIWNELLECAFEISSMGIRVDAGAMRRQLAAAGCESRAELPFHKALLAGKLPQTMGGGIGQSRICMFLLGKRHIGEVQASVWPEAMIEECEKEGIHLL